MIEKMRDADNTSEDSWLIVGGLVMPKRKKPFTVARLLTFESRVSVFELAWNGGYEW